MSAEAIDEAKPLDYLSSMVAQLPSVFLFAGADHLQIEREIERILVEHQLTSQRKPEVFWGDDLQLDSLLTSLNTYSFLSTRKMIRIKEFNLFVTRLSAVDEKRLLQYIRNPNPKSLLIAEMKAAPTGSFYKKLPKHTCCLITLKNPDRNRAEEIIRNIAKEYGVSLAPVGGRWIDQLAQRFKADIGVLESESKKLMLYLSSMTSLTPLSDSEIERLVTNYFDTSVFGFLDQVAAGNIREALKILQRLKAQGEHPLTLFHHLIRQRRLFRLISQYRHARLTPAEIEQKLGLPHFVVQKLLRFQPSQDRAGESANQLLDELSEAIRTDHMLKTQPNISFQIIEKLVMAQ